MQAGGTWRCRVHVDVSTDDCRGQASERGLVGVQEKQAAWARHRERSPPRSFPHTSTCRHQRRQPECASACIRTAMSKAPRRDLKNSQALGRSPATTRFANAGHCLSSWQEGEANCRLHRGIHFPRSKKYQIGVRFRTRPPERVATLPTWACRLRLVRSRIKAPRRCY